MPVVQRSPSMATRVCDFVLRMTLAMIDEARVREVAAGSKTARTVAPNWKPVSGADARAGRGWIRRCGIVESGACLMNRDDISDRLVEITCPALVVHGKQDTAITMNKAEELATGLVGCGGVVQVDGAHAANLTNPEPVNAAIFDFLAGLPA